MLFQIISHVNCKYENKRNSNTLVKLRVRRIRFSNLALLFLISSHRGMFKESSGSMKQSLTMTDLVQLMHCTREESGVHRSNPLLASSGVKSPQFSVLTCATDDHGSLFSKIPPPCVDPGPG